MQHSKKKNRPEKGQESKDNFGRERSKSEPPPSQNIYGKPGVASNLRSRSKLYWIFACCAATQNVVINEDTPNPLQMSSDVSASSLTRARELELSDNSNKEN